MSFLDDSMLAIGIMSGTSLDGVDVVLCTIQGVDESTQVKQLDYLCLPMPQAIKASIRSVCLNEGSNTQAVSQLNFDLGQLFADAVKELLTRNNLKAKDVSFIASHGQTIYHEPHPLSGHAHTLQIGEAAVIAYQTGIQVIDDFRVMDVAAGGEGAPLVPFSERILYGNQNEVIALQNMGGIGNITVLSPQSTLAFDTGPGNMMMDEVMLRFFQKPYDDDGKMALLGEVNKDLLNHLLTHPFIHQAAPKSTGREDFGSQFVDEIIAKFPHIEAKDLLRTFTRFSAECVREAFTLLPQKPTRLIVGGGGAHNTCLMSDLKECLLPCEVLTQEDLGYSSDAKEALAFVILGNQTLHHRPSNVPSATGAKKAVILGKITPIPFN